ncbi:LAG1 longevity assurance-like protein 3 isoform X2 [Hibiscus syriacus]|uniref:LAG1 longevity assurance-like protein 3 isoform X2 n=1 Tax=Hibiscus syriacus TaxID=106335 RepID=A0A6A3B4D5_HIBSY|nr:LAG1 longevity assurance-like protein 3 isoform X2 [Hibiscus syriacus]
MLDGDTEEKRKKSRKFKESAWKCIYYLSAEILALYVTYNEPWFRNTRNFWVGPGDQVWPDQKIKLKLKGLYMYVAGFYADVFLEIGKMSKYSGAETLAGSAFLVFVLSWVLLRLIYYPFWILWSTSYEVLLTLDKEKHPVDGPICYYLFDTLLFCLLVLHVCWWVLMYRMLVKQIQVRGKLSEDVRSDSEDEHED